MKCESSPPPSSSPRRRRWVAVFTAVVILLLVTGFYTVSDHGLVLPLPQRMDSITDKNKTFFHTHRKLLHTEAGNGTKGDVEPTRIWSEKCSKSDIVISQGHTEPLPNGIPTYTVEIMNVCISSCNISAIHLNCGWFSSARLINPHIFKRLSFNDCLVNNGKPLSSGRTLSFQYANTYPYSLSVSSLRC